MGGGDGREGRLFDLWVQVHSVGGTRLQGKDGASAQGFVRLSV